MRYAEEMAKRRFVGADIVQTRRSVLHCIAQFVSDCDCLLFGAIEILLLAFTYLQSFNIFDLSPFLTAIFRVDLC